MYTSVPTGTFSYIHSTSSFSMRMQPWLAAVPMEASEAYAAWVRANTAQPPA